MAEVIASICCTLIILAFCQIIVEAVLPEGGTKKYVMFISGVVGVLAVVAVFTASGGNIMKDAHARAAEIKRIAQNQNSQADASGQTNPYRQYIERLIDSYR
jgi:glucan phosphoethanolaminetransferase (alkaline phosphatase superfamily)